jgi:hypothetical protein
MVRGTYLPLPDLRLVVAPRIVMAQRPTCFGEEGAEALVRIGGFTLFCEVTIGLEKSVTGVIKRTQSRLPGCHVPGSTTPSMNWQFDSRPGQLRADGAVSIW